MRQILIVPRQMVQPQQPLRSHARCHQAMVADTDDGIWRWHRTGLAPVELHRLKPFLRVSVIVQDRAALLDAENLRCCETHTLELTSDVHAGSEAAGAVPYWQRLQLIGPNPILVPERRAPAGMDDAHRHADVGALGDFYAYSISPIVLLQVS